ncbi:hypothetical protein X754_18880 [Mesorhizobium sp. LNJC403B00]|nr:hypothetical protein X754_18880 [Mesorhizobium sp. LNJC403B00]
MALEPAAAELQQEVAKPHANAIWLAPASLLHRVPGFNGGGAGDVGDLSGASLREMETRTGSTRVNGRHDGVVVIAVDAIRRRRPGTKPVTSGYRAVFAHREAALVEA